MTYTIKTDAELKQEKLNDRFLKVMTKDEDKAIALLKKGADPYYSHAEAFKYIIYYNKINLLKEIISSDDKAKDYIQNEFQYECAVPFVWEQSKRVETLSYLINEVQIELDDRIKKSLTNPPTNADQIDIDIGMMMLQWIEKRKLNEKLTFTLENKPIPTTIKMKQQGMKI